MLALGLISRARQLLGRRRGDVVALFVITLLALAFLAPALKDGLSFGGFDFDTSITSLGSGLYHTIHSTKNGDAVSQMISWNALDWRLIHSGHFPLWNQYSAMGMPQFLNFESSVLSLPDLISYAFPIQMAFAVVVFFKLIIAATGMYVLGRVIGLRVIGSLFSAVSFMFAGAFVNLVTWSFSDVFAWSGWICALAILAYRSKRSIYVFGLSVAIAFSIFGGFPEANVMFAMAFVIFAVVVGVVLIAKRQRVDIRGAIRVVFAGLLGVMLSAPLWLAGYGVIKAGHRIHDGHYAGLPLRTLALTIAPGYFGTTVETHGVSIPFQLTKWNYYETASYVGVISLILVVVAVAGNWRRAVVIGAVIAGAFTMVATYQPVDFHPFQSLINGHSGILSTIRFERMRTMTAFFVALVGGVGLDTIARRLQEKKVRLSFFVGTLIAVVITGYLAIDSYRARAALGGVFTHQRFDSLVWPVGLTISAVVIGLFVAWIFRSRTGKKSRVSSPAIAVVLLCAQAAFLFFAGVGVPSYSPYFYKPTAAIKELKAIVGNNLVGLHGGNVSNVRLFAHVGIYPNVNIGYQIRIFGVHDPLIPAAYYSTWPVSGAAKVDSSVGLFVPDIDSAALARRYGIGYIIGSGSLPAPIGTKRVKSVAGEILYKVPGASQFSFVTPRAGQAREVASDGNGSFVLRTRTTKAETLILRVTAMSGWNATIDGRPLLTRTYEGVMESVTVPAGTHTIHLWYWPHRLSEGLHLAELGLLLMVLFGFRANLSQLIFGRARRLHSSTQ